MNEYFPPIYFLSCVMGCLTHIVSSSHSSLQALYLGLTGSNPEAAPEKHSSGLRKISGVILFVK